MGTNDAHELERFRARLRTLEAQLLAEQKRREAAEAEARASRALAEELCRSGRRVGRRPTSRAGPLVVLMVLCSVSTLLAGIFGWYWFHHRGRAKSERPTIPHEIRHLQQRSRRAIAACFQRALRDTPSVSRVHAQVSLRIDPSGRVDEVTVAVKPRVSALAPCVRQVIARWIFRPPGGEGARISFPLQYASNDGGRPAPATRPGGGAQ